MPDNSDLVNQLIDLYYDLDYFQTLHRTNKILFYQPIGKQPDFHAADRATIRLVLGSNRSGKTVSGTVEAIAHALGYRPWLPAEHPNRIVYLPNGDRIPVPNIGRVVAENFQTSIQQTIWPKFQEWLPAGCLKEVSGIKRDQRGIPIKLEFKNNSIIYFMSYDQDDEVYEGTHGHWYWLDEPAPYGKYIALKRGLVDTGGHCWMTMTPLSEPWINDLIVGRAGDPDSQVKVFHYSIYDNAVSKGGHLPDAAIAEFISDLREDERSARIDGQFLHLAGRVFSEWRPDPPYWIEPFKIPTTWPRVCIIDPHPRKPIAVLWAAVSPDNIWIIYRDMFDGGLKTVRDVADTIKHFEGWDKNPHKSGDGAEPIALRIIDTSAEQMERTSGESVRDRFSRENIYCRLAYKQNKSAGIDAIHDALRLKNEWSRPQLQIFNTCKHVKRNFQNYVWEDWATSRQRDLKGDKQEPRKNHDDFIDCIRYIFQARLNYNNLRGIGQDVLHQNDEIEMSPYSFQLNLPHAGYQRMRRDHVRQL